MLIRCCTWSQWRAGVYCEVGHQFRRRVQGSATTEGSCLGREGMFSTSLNSSTWENGSPPHIVPSFWRPLSAGFNATRGMTAAPVPHDVRWRDPLYFVAMMVIPLPASRASDTPTETFSRPRVKLGSCGRLGGLRSARQGKAWRALGSADCL